MGLRVPFDDEIVFGKVVILARAGRRKMGETSHSEGEMDWALE